MPREWELDADRPDGKFCSTAYSVCVVGDSTVPYYIESVLYRIDIVPLQVPTYNSILNPDPE